MVEFHRLHKEDQLQQIDKIHEKHNEIMKLKPIEY